MMSTLNPSLVSDKVWYCILGLLPISPKTTTQARLLGIFKLLEQDYFKMSRESAAYTAIKSFIKFNYQTSNPAALETQIK